MQDAGFFDRVCVFVNNFMILGGKIMLDNRTLL
jgi:hypothetical protein